MSGDKPAARPLSADDPLAPHSATLLSFLVERGVLPSASGATVERFAGGYSNLTYLVRAGAEERVLRTPPPGAQHIKSGHDMAREGRFLTALHPRFSLCPRPLCVVADAADGPLGVPFFVMEKKRGRVVRGSAPPLDATGMTALSETMVDALVALHAVDIDADGGALRALGRPEGYLQRQVDGWRERYIKAQTDDVSDMERLSSWLAAHVPPSSRASVVHNDYKLDNILLDDGGGIAGVLDWELAAIGDPLTDLGTLLAYWVQADDDDGLRALPLGPTTAPGCLTRRQLVARYQERSGRAVEHLSFHYALACFRVAVIAQQIYFRYQRGFTTDARFATLGFAVAVVAQQACRALDEDRLVTGAPPRRGG